MNAGVPKGKLYMEPYRPEWAVVGQETVETLRRVMKKAIDIRHVGSTAVVGMFSKPLIDIAVGVSNLDDVLEYVDELKTLGIDYAGEVVPGQREFSIDDPETGNRLVHIHVVIWNGEQWCDYVTLVDFLNADERAREAYILLKKSLLLRYEDRPGLYGPAKHKFMEDLRTDAHEWSEKRNEKLSD